MAVTNYPFTKVAQAIQLENEIQASAIATALDSIVLNGTNDLNVAFKAALSGGDETILNGLVSAHVPVAIPSVAQLVETTAPKTEDMRDIGVVNRIPLGFTIYPTGRADNITNGTYGDGVKLKFTDVTPGTTDKATIQFLSHWYGIGGRIIWESASLEDEMNAVLVAPASTGWTNSTGDYNKYNVGGPYNMLIPVAEGTGAWTVNLTTKITNTQILKSTPVPAAGNVGWFDYNSETNVLTRNMTQTGGYNLYDFDINLFRFANTIYGRKQDGAESLLEATDVVGKLLYNSWQIRFTLTAVTAGVKCGVIVTTAIKKNI